MTNYNLILINQKLEKLTGPKLAPWEAIHIIFENIFNFGMQCQVLKKPLKKVLKEEHNKELANAIVDKIVDNFYSFDQSFLKLALLIQDDVLTLKEMCQLRSGMEFLKEFSSVSIYLGSSSTPKNERKVSDEVAFSDFLDRLNKKHWQLFDHFLKQRCQTSFLQSPDLVPDHWWWSLATTPKVLDDFDLFP
jgi:hypothetical protein